MFSAGAQKTDFGFLRRLRRDSRPAQTGTSYVPYALLVQWLSHLFGADQAGYSSGKAGLGKFSTCSFAHR
jgi:hypothetical protein